MPQASMAPQWSFRHPLHIFVHCCTGGLPDIHQRARPGTAPGQYKGVGWVWEGEAVINLHLRLLTRRLVLHVAGRGWRLAAVPA